MLICILAFDATYKSWRNRGTMGNFAPNQADKIGYRNVLSAQLHSRLISTWFLTSPMAFNTQAFNTLASTTLASTTLASATFAPVCLVPLLHSLIVILHKHRLCEAVDLYTIGHFILTKLKKCGYICFRKVLRFHLKG